MTTPTVRDMPPPSIGTVTLDDMLVRRLVLVGALLVADVGGDEDGVKWASDELKNHGGIQAVADTITEVARIMAGEESAR